MVFLAGAGGGVWTLKTILVALCWRRMASITLKQIPGDLHATLKGEAEANYRSLAQEVMARLQSSLDAERATRRDQAWVSEALASGPEDPFSREKFNAAVNRGLQRAQAKARA